MIVTLMKQHSTRVAKLADYLVMIILVVVPFQGFVTVWGQSLVGHYTLLRLWDEVLFLILCVIIVYWLYRDQTLRRWFMGSMLVRLIAVYVGLTLLLGIVALAKSEVSLKALTYGVLVDLRFFVWFLAALLVAQRSPFLARTWPRIVLIPAAIVVIFASLQYTVLPHNFLTHFGYNAHTTIAPIETINHNSKYIRAQSTLRGANPLGAYLVLVLSILGALFFRGKRKLACAIFGAVALFALYASGSRSAWIGTLLSLAALVWLQLKSYRQRLYLGVAAAVLAVAAVGGFLLIHNNVSVQNEVLHTQAHSAIKIGSDQAHITALKKGISDVLRQPFGDGPGTAGPASVYNRLHPARIADNYFIQIAQELGWFGLALFLTIAVLVTQELYQRIGQSRLALALVVALVGISFVCMLSHAWTDDTLAYLWWGLAGIVVGSVVPEREKA